MTDPRTEAARYSNGGPSDPQGTRTWDEFTEGCRLLTRAMAERLGFWNEGLAQYETTADTLIRRGLIEREDAHIDDCD